MPLFCAVLCKLRKVNNAGKLAEICKNLQNKQCMQENRAKFDGKNKISCKNLKKRLYFFKLFCYNLFIQN